jgi:UDP-GlcNAc:undecaprenyl-phosphate GlcNAc-1-phosphate transferase
MQAAMGARMNEPLWGVLLVTVIPAFLVSVLATGWIARHASKLGLLDRPNARKVHTTPIPLGGGIGIWLGVVVVFAVGSLTTWMLVSNSDWAKTFLPESVSIYLPGLLSRIGSIWLLIAGGTVLMMLGLLDDRFGLDWKLRLAVEIGVASSIVYGQHLQLTAYIDAPWLTSILSVLWIVMLINSFNMLDNMDALSGGVASIICAMLSVMLLSTPESSMGQPQLFVAAMMLTLLGGLLGFLKHNWPPAKIFMGDAGSYFVGYWIAIGTLLST